MGRPKGSKNKPKVLDSTPTSSTVVKKTTNSQAVSTSTTSTKKQPMDKVDKLLANAKKNSSKVIPSIETPSGMKTVKEVANYTNKQEHIKEIFAATKNMMNTLQLTDLSKTESRTFQSYSRETLRTYLKSPKSYEQQLRNLSRYLYRLCYEYKRICVFFARMICGDAFQIIPTGDPRTISDDEIINNYYDTALRWHRMDIKNELTKLLIVAWREDTVYAYVYDDSDQEGGTCFYHVLDGDYCRVSSVENGVCRFAFDFSYFRRIERL